MKSIFLFHAFDEPALPAWQSGVYYADGTPKQSLPAVRDAVRAGRGGVIAKCPDLHLTPKAVVGFPTGKALKSVPLAVVVKCDIDCTALVRLSRQPRNSTTLETRAHLQAGVLARVQLPARKIAAAVYRFSVRLTAPVNVGPPKVAVGRPVTIPSG